MELSACLDDLESRIDDGVEGELLDQWKRFAELRCGDAVFDPRRPAPSLPAIGWPRVRVNSTLDDFDRMAIHQFESCSTILAAAGGNLLCVRCNYGTPILPAPFGAELFIMPDETDTLPACHPLPGGAEAIRRLLDQPSPSLDHPYLAKVFEMGRRFADIAKRYPKIGRHVHIYHPDVQGPMDVMEMLWGSDIFIGLYDEPDLAHAMLNRLCEFYIQVMRHWESIIPPMQSFAPHWGMLHAGRIMLRDDSAMNLSPDMFKEFVLPYDSRLLSEFGGGAMHACGKLDHFSTFLRKIPSLRAFNCSQPHLNNMAKVFDDTIDQGITLIGLNRSAAVEAMAGGRDLRGRVHVN